MSPLLSETAQVRATLLAYARGRRDGRILGPLRDDERAVLEGEEDETMVWVLAWVLGAGHADLLWLEGVLRERLEAPS